MRCLSLFSPPSSSLTEDYSFGLIDRGPGAGDSCWCRFLGPGKRAHCIFWTSQPMHESSAHRGGCGGCLGASHGSAVMRQTRFEVWLQPGTCLRWGGGGGKPSSRTWPHADGHFRGSSIPSAEDAEPHTALCLLEEGAALFKHPSAFLLLQRSNLYIKI